VTDTSGVTERPAPLADDMGANVPARLDDELVEHELLVEEVSIDGMCGVY
jgi:mycofactocin precursor